MESLDSFESIKELVSCIFTTKIPLYFSNKHMEILKSLLANFLNCDLLLVIETNVPLIEPIMEDDDKIYLYRPAIAEYINQPINIKKPKLKNVKNFNIFNRINHNNIRPNKSSAYENVVERNIVSKSNYDDDESYNSKANKIRVINLYKLVFLLRHFLIHKFYNIPFRNHEKFQDYEIEWIIKPKKTKQVFDDDIDYQRKLRKNLFGNNINNDTDKNNQFYITDSDVDANDDDDIEDDVKKEQFALLSNKNNNKTRIKNYHNNNNSSSSCSSVDEDDEQNDEYYTNAYVRKRKLKQRYLNVDCGGVIYDGMGNEIESTSAAGIDVNTSSSSSSKRINNLTKYPNYILNGEPNTKQTILNKFCPPKTNKIRYFENDRFL